MAFLGRFSPDKWLKNAIAIAKETPWRLDIGKKANLQSSKVFEQEIAPYIAGQQIQYLGKINYAGKTELLGNAAIAVFPIA
ncbi:MAG: hypothetical protein RMX96_20450 [Nostoc sp. ChiSLP02]|nr:hypothetical protein [Nostoc sp. DedSLP05]MDZ8103985.1 hypothetical protein [Nostoc sp. DedSLP01]MDZ8187205.1 hypothetical protein [Nostoc sp. ChiSLP02]